MKRWIAMMILVALTLVGCQIAEPAGTDGKTPTGSGSSQPPESSDEDVDWAPESWTQLSYDEYFSRPRAAEPSWGWVSPSRPGATFYLVGTENGLEVQMINSESAEAVPVYQVPDSEELAEITWASNGRRAYGVRDGREVLELELKTGKTRTLFSGEKVRELTLAGQDLLFFLAETGEEVSLLRLYLPEERLDTVAALPGYNEHWLSYQVEDSALVELRYMNPDFYPLLLQTMADAAGPIRQSEAFLAPEMARAFTAENQAAPEWENGTLLLCWAVQFDSGVRPLIRRSLDTLTGETEDAFGVLDNCYFGTGDNTHDHFSPEALNYSPADYNWPVGLEKSGLDASFQTVIPLTEEELASYQALFTVVEDPYALQQPNYYAAALSGTFDGPEEAPAEQFLAGGFPEEGPLTNVEQYLLGSQVDLAGEEYFRLPAGKARAVLSQYLGTTSGLEALIYLEETDCYYIPAAAQAPKGVTFTGGEYLCQNRAVRLFYTDENGREMVLAMYVHWDGVGNTFWYHLPAEQAQGWMYGQYE